ncbi:hypothetical protein EYF80_035278 [Liparis tanakae]|uniref:Uncharacterized protein n=1 Tax=Liparis tanakae TaxID=230148 RepID=A0A4Z2GNW1_9TELE|nr:hypothetical protein EYF80_035278 [Liparis tanakae]
MVENRLLDAQRRSVNIRCSLTVALKLIFVTQIIFKRHARLDRVHYDLNIFRQRLPPGSVTRAP